MTDSLFREIDDDMRKERLEQLWKRHGRKIVALVLALVIGAASFTVWQQKQSAKLEAETTSLASLLQTATPENGGDLQTKLDALAQTAPAGQAMLARLYASGLTKDAAQHDAAVKQLQALARESKQPLYRDLATLLAVQLQIGTGDAAKLKQDLAPLMGDTQPWRSSARELAALLSLQTGDKDGTKALLGQIKSDKDAPQGVKKRADQLLSTLL